MSTAYFKVYLYKMQRYKKSILTGNVKKNFKIKYCRVLVTKQEVWIDNWICWTLITPTYK
jgi:hypothetical protein